MLVHGNKFRRIGQTMGFDYASQEVYDLERFKNNKVGVLIRNFAQNSGLRVHTVDSSIMGRNKYGVLWAKN